MAIFKAQLMGEFARFSRFFTFGAANFSCFAEFWAFHCPKRAIFAFFDILSHCFPYFYCRSLAHFRAVRINEKKYRRHRFFIFGFREILL